MTSSSLAQDLQLLSRCFTGDQKASARVVRRFSGLIYHSVQHTLLVKNIAFIRQDVEDLHNTVFLQLFENNCKKLRQYRGKNGCSLATWIKVVTVRIVLNHIRKKGFDAMSGRKNQMAFDDLPDLKANTPEGWTLIERSEQKRLIQDGIRTLSPRDRLFVKLHFDRGLPEAEVAEIMQLSVQNIYTVKHRAIQRLKSHVTSAAKM